MKKIVIFSTFLGLKFVLIYFYAFSDIFADKVMDTATDLGMELLVLKVKQIKLILIYRFLLCSVFIFRYGVGQIGSNGENIEEN